jgi:hypothetical protein
MMECTPEVDTNQAADLPGCRKRRELNENTSSRQTENTTAKQKLNETLETEVQGYLASKELQPPK